MKKIVKRYKLKQDIKDGIIFILLCLAMILLFGIIENMTF